MATRRVLKVAEVIREVVAMAILRDLKDPRIRDVTVVGVEVSGDLRQAKVHVSIMGDETRQSLSFRGLQNSAGYLQSKIADRIDSRFTPRLEFVLDQGVKKSLEISRILSQVIPKTPNENAGAATSDIEGHELQEHDLAKDDDEGDDDEGDDDEGDDDTEEDDTEEDDIEDSGPGH